jgi:hypothetical protein
VIERLQNQHSLVILVTNSLTSYMDKVREIAKGRIFSYFVFLCTLFEESYKGIFKDPMLMFTIQIKYFCCFFFQKIMAWIQTISSLIIGIIIYSKFKKG